MLEPDLDRWGGGHFWKGCASFNLRLSVMRDHKCSKVFLKSFRGKPFFLGAVHLYFLASVLGFLNVSGLLGGTLLVCLGIVFFKRQLIVPRHSFH